MEVINEVIPNINQFKSLEIKLFFEKNMPNFGLCTRYIRNKKNLFIVKKFIESLGKIIKYNGIIITERVFMSIYIIKYFSSDVFANDNKLSEQESALHDKANIIIEKLHTFDSKSMIEICNIIKSLNQFKNLFSKWKSKDLESQIDIYLQLYLRYEKEIKISNSKNDDFLKHLIEVRDKSKNYIIKLTSENEFNRLIENKKILETKFDNSVENLVRHYLRNAFWDRFKDDLNEDIPNFYQIKGIIKDIKNYFLKIYKNKKNKIQYINEILDVEFYGQLIKNKVLTLTNIVNLSKNILNDLKEIDAAYTDKINRDYYSKLDNDDKINQIVESLKFIMTRLEFVSDLIFKINK